MQARGKNNEVLRLKDYHVQPNSTIYLLVLLWAEPDELDNLVFDFFWKYPHSGCNFLDASVLLYSGFQFVEVIDCNHTASQSCSAVQHSGDVMNHAKRLGHHSINVSIKSIPVHINKLVFTLSARNSPNISKYPNLSLKCFDANFPDKGFFSDIISHAAYSQAIIICCLTNTGSRWEVIDIKKMSAGNAKNYEPLKKSIVGLLRNGFI
jgi:stress response protein SCP2